MWLICGTGLAISGGVDSMALAHLCHGIVKEELLSVEFQAFVVDHGARQGSSLEASTVVSRLGNIGE